jgi:predicted Zn finger-like uncharacterized protein
MLTQCPNCDTTFRVTSEILRVAQGQVRCGRCDTQFDALERLIEEDEEEDGQAEEEYADDADLELSEPDLEDEQATETEEEEEDAAEEWVELDDIDAQGEMEDESQALTDPGEDEALEEEDEGFAAEAETIAQEQEVEEPEEPTEEELEAQAIAEARPRGDWRRSPQPQQQQPSQPQQTISRQARSFEDTDQFMLGKRAVRVPSAALWKYLAAPLGLLFAFQVLDHYRAPLARHPRLGGTVSGLYRVLGIDLIPDWKLRAYEIKQLGAVSDPALPGTLTVRASVRNRAAFPQPYPLVKLVLEDRFGATVRAREFEPIEYLDKTPPPNTLMASQQEIRATIAIVDPGPDAEGFTVDVCLQGNKGSVCAEDVPQTSP